MYFFLWSNSVLSGFIHYNYIMANKKLLSKSILILFIVCLVLIISMVILLFNLHLPSEQDYFDHQTQIAETNTVVQLETDTARLSADISIPPTQIPLPDASATPLTLAMNAVDYFMGHTTQDSYTYWINALSGEIPVVIDGVERTIDTRYSYAMFLDQENARAPQYLLQTIRQWVPEDQIVYEPYQYADGTSSYTWYNIVVTFPGTVSPQEQILYIAHYDSCVALTNDDPLLFAPGANDNGTGVAALLEALPVFAKTSFEKTVKVIFLSGEENFLQGSKAYVNAHADTDNIKAVVNMDMFGNDSDGDRCFEIHVGSIPESDAIGQVYRQVISDYNLNLKYDYLAYAAFSNGDHSQFWARGIPAILIMENFLSDSSEGGCGVKDATPNWHLPSDHIKDVNIPYAFDIARAGTITVMRLAGATTINE